MNEISFFMCFHSGALIFLNTARPWSLYKPKSFILCFSLILFSINMPTNSKISVPSHGPMVTSKRFSFSRFFITKQKSFSGIIHNFYVFDAHISYFFSEVERFFMSKIATLYLLLSFRTLRNRSITSLVPSLWLVLA